MKYDFNKIVKRRHTGSLKWDATDAEDVIPLWVADMDFEVAPAIQEALRKRIEHGVFGYSQLDKTYYDAIVSWFARRHDWEIDPQWIIYTSGVVPAISSTLKALTLPGENVLVMTPVYNCFFSSIQNQGCRILETELRQTGDGYEIDWDDFENKCKDEKTTVFLLCNPHNPAGRVWTKEELQKIGDICYINNVCVVSDEIHCELIMPGYHFTPFATTSKRNQENSVTLNSPSKSFNIAGLQIANIICKDAVKRRRIDRVINIYELCDVNCLGPEALKAAYNESEEWLDELNDYIWGNYTMLRDFFHHNLPQAQVLRLEGTYLAWINIKAFRLSSDEAMKKLLKEGRVFVNSGTAYGKHAGEGYLRINMACPRTTLRQGLERLMKVLEQYVAEKQSEKNKP